MIESIAIQRYLNLLIARCKIFTDGGKHLNFWNGISERNLCLEV